MHLPAAMQFERIQLDARQAVPVRRQEESQHDAKESTEGEVVARMAKSKLQQYIRTCNQLEFGDPLATTTTSASITLNSKNIGSTFRNSTGFVCDRRY